MASDKQGKSSTTKVVAIVLIGGGLVFLLCCGGLFWFGKNWFQKFMITDPVAVKTRAAAIADIAIPETYQPQMAMDMNQFGVPMTMCMFMRTGGEGAVMLMEMTGPMAGDQEQMRQQFQQSMQQQQGGRNQIDITSTETRTYLINGEEYEFEFSQGTRPQDKVAVRQVMGVMPGKAGTAFLMVFETEENWDEAAITGMIESMGAKLVETSEEAPADGTTPDDAATPEAGAEAEAPADPGEPAVPGEAPK
jgi:hypothetical protein